MEDMHQEIYSFGDQSILLDSLIKENSQLPKLKVIIYNIFKAKFDAGQHVILCVNNGGHYVLMTSYSGDTFNVNDPGYSKTSYPASGVTNAATYTHSKIEYFKNHVLNLEWYYRIVSLEKNISNFLYLLLITHPR